MYRQSYEFPLQPQPPTRGEFLRQEFTSLRYCDNEGAKEFADVQPGPIELWLTKVQSYEALSSDKVILAHHDLFDEGILRDKLGPLLERAHVGLQTSQLSYGPWDTLSNDKGVHKFMQEAMSRAREWEDNEGWLHSFTDDDVYYIADKLAPHKDRLEALGLNLTWSGTLPSRRFANFMLNTTELAKRELYFAEAWDYLG